MDLKKRHNVLAKAYLLLATICRSNVVAKGSEVGVESQSEVVLTYCKAINYFYQN